MQMNERFLYFNHTGASDYGKGSYFQVKGLGGRMDMDYEDDLMYDDYEMATWRDTMVGISLLDH